MNYFINNYSRIFTLLYEHLIITTISFLIALLIALPIGIFICENKILKRFVLNISGIIYLIPSMALFALLIPILGLGKKTAIVTLIIYSQFILIRNIVKGLEEVPKSLLDAGKGIGFNKFQLFIKIKLPSALPIFIAGMRIAIISIISLTTLAAWINAGGLGVLIFEGLYYDNFEKLIIGIFFTASLSLLFNFFLIKLEERFVTVDKEAS